MNKCDQSALRNKLIILEKIAPKVKPNDMNIRILTI